MAASKEFLDAAEGLIFGELKKLCKKITLYLALQAEYVYQHNPYRSNILAVFDMLLRKH